MRIHTHTEEIQFDVTTLGDYPIVLGIPWFERHSPTVRWKQRRVLFESDDCYRYCKVLSPNAITHVDAPKKVRIGGITVPSSSEPTTSTCVRAGSATVRPHQHPPPFICDQTNFCGQTSCDVHWHDPRYCFAGYFPMCHPHATRAMMPFDPHGYHRAYPVIPFVGFF